MYNYPIDYEMFTQSEIIDLINFLALIEDINENKIKTSKSEVIEKYKQYSKIINSKTIEKQMDKEFEKVSGYSIYQTMKRLK